MSLQVLHSQQQILDARQALIARRLSHVEPQWMSAMRRFLQRVRLELPPPMGDRLKSWDVLSTIDFLQGAVPKDAPVLDIGCFASESILALHDAGFSNLTGIDLNPGVRKMKYAQHVDYRVADFLENGLSEDSYNAITAISVIEHGFQPRRLAAEIARLLKPGGYFVASFDYWPDKIDTSGIRIFDLEWLIFSKDDVVRFVSECATHGLRPAGELSFDAGPPVIHQGRFHYTFAWMVLRKQS
jgi:SAM-dependent methyltransferase